MNWHESQKDKNKMVNLSIPISTELSKKFPEDVDKTPKHIVLLFVGNFNPLFENKLKEIVQNVCSNYRPFNIKIGKRQRKFYDNDGNKISYFPIFSRKLKEINNVLRQELLRNKISVDSKQLEYIPHVKIETIKEGERPKFKKLRFDENQVLRVENLWVWGTGNPIMIPFGKK
jgi:2'-5' RNA ligase